VTQPISTDQSGQGPHQAISLGSCGHLRQVRVLTWANGCGAASSGPAAFTVVPRCSPLVLVHLWCGDAVRHVGFPSVHCRFDPIESRLLPSVRCRPPSCVDARNAPCWLGAFRRIFAHDGV
jgi:hypothetical protein